MKIAKTLFAVLLAAITILSLASCNKESGNNGDGQVNIPVIQTGDDDFQKNLHQYIKPDHNYSFVETDAGYYFTSYGTLYFIEKETGKATVVCAKPDCDHTDDAVCNARLHADYLLTGGERLFYVRNIDHSDESKLVQSVKPDATQQETVQQLKYNESSSASSADSQAIYHRGYVYYVSDDVLYRVKLGGEKDSAEVVWSPENAGETQMQNSMLIVTGNELTYTLWADGETLYFIVNLQMENGTYKDVLFQCNLHDLSVKQVWNTPDKEDVGEWETTSVSVSQWYITGGYIYFYLAGNGLWRTELTSGQHEKLADTGEIISYGSAVYSDEYVYILNDVPKFLNFSSEPYPGSPFRYDGDTFFVYKLDGTFVKELPISSLDGLNSTTYIDLLFCDNGGVYFTATGESFDDPDDPTHGTGKTETLCYASFETGEVSQLYKLR